MEQLLSPATLNVLAKLISEQSVNAEGVEIGLFIQYHDKLEDLFEGANLEVVSREGKGIKPRTRETLKRANRNIQEHEGMKTLIEHIVDSGYYLHSPEKCAATVAWLNQALESNGLELQQRDGKWRLCACSTESKARHQIDLAPSASNITAIGNGYTPSARTASEPENTLRKEDAISMQTRDTVFISYCHKDERRWLDDLLTHLKPYTRDRSISLWSDRQIKPGSEWYKEIQTALASAKVAVLLVTPNFLASDFIHEKELAPLLKEAMEGGVRIIWIPVRSSAYEKSPIGALEAVIPPERPLATMRAERDAAWVKICKEIERALNP